MSQGTRRGTLYCIVHSIPRFGRLDITCGRVVQEKRRKDCRVVCIVQFSVVSSCFRSRVLVCFCGSTLISYGPQKKKKKGLFLLPFSLNMWGMDASNLVYFCIHDSSHPIHVYNKPTNHAPSVLPTLRPHIQFQRYSCVWNFDWQWLGTCKTDCEMSL